MVTKGPWKIWICVLAVLLLSVVCTAVSVRNYISDLNRVTISSSVDKEFVITQDGTGNIYFSKTDTLAIPEGCSVEQWFVSIGSDFAEGDALAKLHLGKFKEKL